MSSTSIAEPQGSLTSNAHAASSLSKLSQSPLSGSSSAVNSSPEITSPPTLFRPTPGPPNGPPAQITDRGTTMNAEKHFTSIPADLDGFRVEVDPARERAD